MNLIEQDRTKVDESEAAMEVTPPDQLVNVVPEAKIVPEASLQETVPATGNQVTSDVEEEENDNDEEEDVLDRYLNTMMIVMTMSLVKAKKACDLGAIIACPQDDHKVDLKVGKGFFLIDVADIARKTMEGMLGFAYSTRDIQGFAGYTDCRDNLAQAIEDRELPDEVFCYEGETKHLTGIDQLCVIHAPITSGQRQVVMNLCKL